MDYQKDENKIIKKYEKQGKNHELCTFNNNCEICSRRRNFDKTEYELALEQFIKKEFGEEFV